MRKSKNPDGCCDCCDLNLFSTLLVLGAATAAATRAPALDRAGWRRSGATGGGCPRTGRGSAGSPSPALVAVERHGLAVGGQMAAERLRRCRPAVPRGTHDPVR
ncbi:membrane protein insertion efficiency factor YidD [Micromonospora rubida]